MGEIIRTGAGLLALALFTMVCGGSWTKAGFSLPVFAGKTVAYAVIFGAVWLGFGRLMGRPFKIRADQAYRQMEGSEKKKRRLFLLEWNRQDILMTAAFLGFIYLIWLLIFYPGVCNADTANQLRDLYTGIKPMSFQWYGGLEKVSATLNDHHPVFDTLVFAAFYQIGLWLGSMNFGMFLYNLFQIAATSLAFSLMLCVMERLNVPLGVRRAGLIYLGGMPFIAMYVINMMKDPLYSLFFVFYFVDYILLIREEPVKGRLVRLIVWSVLLALTKKTGVYLVLIANLFLLAVPKLRKKALWIVSSALIPALLIFIVMGKIIFPACNVYPGGKQEAIGLPLQQVALAVIDHPDEISEEDRQIINDVIDYDAIPEAFDMGLQDGIKKLFYFDTEGAAVVEFLKLWLRWAPRYPGSYLKAAVWLTGGYFCLKGKISIYREVTQRGLIKWTNPGFLEPLRKAAGYGYYGLRLIPGIGLLFRLVIYVWWLPLLVFFYLVKKKAWLGCLCFMPVILSVGVLILCPYDAARYALSQLYVVPMIAGLGWVWKDAGSRT